MGIRSYVVRFQTLGKRSVTLFTAGLAFLLLTVAATAQQVTLSTTSMSFANTPVGTTSAVKKATLTNTGTVSLTITSITTTGPFAQTNTCGTTVKAGKNCTISVTFSPTVAGEATGVVTITDNATNSPQTITLSGDGITGVSVTPTKLTFPTTTIGTTSAPLTSTLANNNTTALTITSITITGAFAQTNNCGSSLAADSKCTITVTYTPTATGTQTGVVTITDSASNSPQKINLTGTGQSSSATLTSISISPGSALLSVGNTLQLTATGYYSNGTTQNLTTSATWSTSNSSAATVAAGLVTAVANGSSSITASYTGVTSELAPLNIGTGADYFIATNGKDSWSGTLAAPNATNTDGPFATIAHTQTAVQTLVANANGRTTPITVQIEGGNYYQQALTFTAADSGTATLGVLWENYPNQTPVISGGMVVTGWTNTSGNTYETTLPESTVYFENLFYNGGRRLRPRVGGSLGTYLRNVGPIYLAGSPPPAPAPNANCAVYVTGSGWECFDRFTYHVGDVSSTWTNLNAPYPTGDIELLDFELWSTPKMRISSIDSVNHIVYLTGATHQQAGVHGFIPNHRYVVENVKDLLTQPGQWFLDRSVTPWTLTYLANSGENPPTDTIIIPQSTQVLKATYLQYVTFQGLQFEHDNFTSASGGYVSTQQEPLMTAALGCYNCQYVTFNSDIISETAGAGIEFTTTDNSSTTSHNTFENGALYDIGGLGIRIGLLPASANTDSNVPQFTTVENTLFEGFSRVIPSSPAIVQGAGHDNTYTHNDIYDGYHSGIEVCLAPTCSPGTKNSSGTFNNVASYNHVFDLYEGVTDDGGAIYFATGGSAFVATGNQIVNNKIHDTSDASIIDSDGYGGYGINLDGSTGLVTVENNLVYRVSAMGINMTHGPQLPNKANTVTNNIFAYARQGMIANGNPYLTDVCPSGGPNLIFNTSNNLFYFDLTSTGGFYVQSGCDYACGSSLTSLHNWQSNLYWRANGTFNTDPDAFHYQTTASSPNICASSSKSWTFETFAGWQGLGEDLSGVSNVNPGFTNPVYPYDDYSLPNGSPGVGFVVFDPSDAGRNNPIIKPTDPIDIPATMVTTFYNPASSY
ncbi:MAG: choice-of-anchor D domain-containing protein [Candidatus Sulfotelmatobacter sp.]